MTVSRGLMALSLLGLAGLAGCQSASRALGLAKITPDEFRVVSKAPLTLPPDYSLRPPAPGEPRPQELEPESAAREALVGQRQAEVRSDGEKLLVAKAGGDKADPLIRYVVDDQFGAIAHKDKSFADWVIFWHKGQPPVGTEMTQAADISVPIDPGTEEKRISNLTGNQTIVIEREGPSKIKLPGL
ncbi:MAG TPA: DUF3035 domain-containing protein [Caulobacteraceae bacterium]